MQNLILFKLRCYTYKTNTNMAFVVKLHLDVGGAVANELRRV